MIIGHPRSIPDFYLDKDLIHSTKHTLFLVVDPTNPLVAIQIDYYLVGQLQYDGETKLK